MFTKEIMTSKVICVSASDTMVNAYKIMHEKGIRHLPVLDERNSVVGILSDRDIQRAMSTHKLNNFQQEVKLDGTLMVEDFMSWPVYVVSEETTLKKVAEEMLDQKVSAFLVQDNLGQMKGIVTTDDFLKLFISEAYGVQKDIPFKALSEFLAGPQVAMR